MRNSDQSDFNLFADYTQAEIVIVPAISSNLLRCQGNAVGQLAGYSLEKPLCYADVSFSYLSLSN